MKHNTHFAKRNFRSLKETIEEVCQASYSIGQSDFPYIFKNIDSIEDADKALDYFLKTEKTFAYVEVSIDKKNIEYSTASAINHITITKIDDNNWLALYAVSTKKTFLQSSAMKAFQNAGWDCYSFDDFIEFEDLGPTRVPIHARV